MGNINTKLTVQDCNKKQIILRQLLRSSKRMVNIQINIANFNDAIAKLNLQQYNYPFSRKTKL